MRAFAVGLWSYRSLIIIFLTPLLLLPLPLVIPSKVSECAYTLILMAVFWMTEAMPLSVTALLPAFLFPLFGIMKSSVVATMYFKDFHLLLLGVICLATSIEKWGLHRRIALKLVTLVGVNPGMLMLGMMVGCGFLSMWLSNTSTVAMVMPIVEAVMQQVMSAEGQVSTHQEKAMSGICNPALQMEDAEKQSEKGKEVKSADPVITEIVLTVPEEDHATENLPYSPLNSKYRTHRDHMMCKCLSLCIAYSACIGGLTTLPGTSSNLIFAEYIHQFYPECKSINFGNWFIFSLPICIIIMLLGWVWLHWLFLGLDFRYMLCSKGGRPEREIAAAKLIKEEYNALGPVSRQEKITLVIFSLMALLWFVRDPGFMPGWASLFPDYPGYATDATVALILGVFLFIIPAKRPTADGYEAMISWKEFEACMPWEICLLVGGGFALAEGTKVSGLSSWVAELMTPLGSLPVLAIVAIACIIVTSVTEVASNPATITIFLPILSPLAEAIKVNPLYMLIPATLSVSFSFLLPFSNPPNAIVFVYGHLSIMDMVKAGLGLNIIGVLVVLLAISTWGTGIFDLNTFPDWANSHGLTNTTGF
ncbi:solute carrier family 13 member 1 isoform X2 [Astyanax mexicanus]|uniref:Solute carrier family 13 member 1 isoform X2 n=2 Tax=Astyanax mexicanus TaxID=7994 RepID=A0A8B9J5J9_ASTMX|nr:solute carrier family 13 member 1 isoform X2 [Astyanax mexicanus]KAG9280949.1 solute carrier family 13 member 1 isoform X2 [Astyanax mexicanus]